MKVMWIDVAVSLDFAADKRRVSDNPSTLNDYLYAATGAKA